MVTPDSFDRTPKQTSKEIFEQVMAMRDQAVSLDNEGKHTEALEILILAEKKCRQNRHMDALLTILRQKAILLSAGGNHNAALQVIEDVEQICYALSDWESLYSILRSKSVFETFASRPSQGGIIHLLRRPRSSHLESRSKASGEQT